MWLNLRHKLLLINKIIKLSMKKYEIVVFILAICLVIIGCIQIYYKHYAYGIFNVAINLFTITVFIINVRNRINEK